MTTIENKRLELTKVQSLINKITSVPVRRIKALNPVSKKMMLSNLNELTERKSTLLSEIVSMS